MATTIKILNQQTVNILNSENLINKIFTHSIPKQLIVGLFCIVFTQCNGQSNIDTTNNYSKTIKEQASVMANALLSKDFNTYKKFISPKMSEIFGGEEKMIEQTKNGINQLENQGTKFLNVTFGEPSNIIIVDNELQCTIPQKSEVKISTGKLITTSTLVVVSDDNGKNWFFIDTFGKDIQFMRTNFPTLNLSDRLVIPEKPQPTVIKE